MKTFADYGIIIPPDARFGEVYVNCPKCSPSRKKSNDPCLSANTEKEVWHCHHCGWGGGLKSGEERNSQPNAWKQEFYRPPPVLPVETISNGALVFFKSRGITEPTLRRNKVCTGEAWIPQLEALATAIFFPYFDNGQLKNIKYRAQPKHFCMVAGAELVPYGLDDVRDSDTVIWVEGEIDKLSMEEAMFPNCLSVPNGAPSASSKNYSSKFDFLTPYVDLFAPKKHYIAVDNDEPGVRLQEELSRRLGRESCWLVTWPAGCKDANEVLMRYGVAEIQDCIKKAKPYPIAGITTVEDVLPNLVELYRRGLPRGKSTGWSNIDEFYTVRPGELNVVTGTPGAGKSEFIDALMVNLAESYDWRFGIFSPENHPIERHVAKLIEKQVGLPFGAGPSQRAELSDIAKSAAWLHHHFYFIQQDEAGLTVDALISKFAALVKRHGINGMVVDPWNELDHTRPERLSETEYISLCLTKFRRFARINGVALWLVAHPTKLRKDEHGKYNAPSLYDISGSAHWYNKADNGLIVHRDKVDGGANVEIHIAKIRFKEVGQVGATMMRYDRLTGKYYDLPM